MKALIQIRQHHSSNTVTKFYADGASPGTLSIVDEAVHFPCIKYREFCHTSILNRKGVALRSKHGIIKEVGMTCYDPLLDENVRIHKLYYQNPAQRYGVMEFIKQIAHEMGQELILYDNAIGSFAEYVICEEGRIPSIFYERGERTPAGYKISDYILRPFPVLFTGAFDIEVEVGRDGSFPTATHNPITFISYHSAKQRVLFTYARAFEFRNTIEYEPEHVSIDVRYFSDETTMLVGFFEFIENVEESVICTYNGDDFDIPYLSTRAHLLGVMCPFHTTEHFKKKNDDKPETVKKNTEYREGGKGNEPYWYLSSKIHVDICRFIQSNFISSYALNEFSFPNYKLDTVSDIFLNKRKLQISFKTSGDLEIGVYCWFDSFLTQQLMVAHEELIMRTIMTFMRLSCLPMEEASRFWLSHLTKQALFFICRQKNTLVPTRERWNQEDIDPNASFQGATVLDTQYGIYEDAIILDFESLYPGIVKYYNISPDTINCKHMECQSNRLVGIPKYHTCIKRIGIIPEYLGDIRGCRIELVKPALKQNLLSKILKMLDQGLKVFINGMYGLLGNKYFIFYRPACAESVTAMGRHLILNVVTWMKEYSNVQVIAGDTDSVFLHGITSEQIETVVARSKAELGVGLAVDHIYSLLFLPPIRKNYFGIEKTKTGMKLVVKGLKFKKSDSPRFETRIIQRLLDDILTCSSNDDKMHQFVMKKMERIKHPDWVPVFVENMKKVTDSEERSALVRQAGGLVPVIVEYIRWFASYVSRRAFLEKLAPEEFLITKRLSKTDYVGKQPHLLAAQMEAFFTYQLLDPAQQDSIRDYQQLIHTGQNISFVKVQPTFIEQMRSKVGVVPESLLLTLNIKTEQLDLKKYLKNFLNTLNQITLSFNFDLTRTTVTRSLMEDFTS